jgi:magnesium transporter
MGAESVLPTRTGPAATPPSSRSSGTAAPRTSLRPAALLEDRVEDLVVVEFRSDCKLTATRELKMSVRGLYRYVLAAITGEGGKDEKDGSGLDRHRRASSLSQHGLMTTKMTTPEGTQGELSSPPPAYSHSRKSKQAKRSTASASVDGSSKKNKESGHVTYRDRLGSYLSPRDMRRLAIPVSKRNEPEIMVRRHAICVNMDPLPAIILRDRMLVIVPLGNGGWVEGTVSPANLVARVREALEADGSDWSASCTEDTPGATVTASECSGDPKTAEDDGRSSVWLERNDEGDTDDESNEWKDIQERNWMAMPFELQCLDSILTCTLEKLAEDTREVQVASREYVNKFVAPKRRSQQQYQDPHLIICAVKDAASEVSSRVKAVVTALTRTLDDYEDMSLMNLSRLVTHPELFIQPVPIAVLEQESDQPELLLEAHLQTGLALASALDLVKGQIESTTVLIEQNLDAVRNRLLLANMILTVVSVCIGVASLVGSFMGMNLWNGIETSRDAFMIVVIATLVATAVLFLVILLFLFSSGTIPVPGLGGG